MSWSDISDWWLSEVADDPAYEEVVTPLLLEVLRPKPSHKYLDLGCGEGRVMRTLEGQSAVVHGLDINFELAKLSTSTVVGDLRRIPMRSNCYDGVFCVLALEHVDDVSSVFSEAARIVRSGGVFALVSNHPTWTAPGSTPISDTDGEVLWRPAEYFGSGSTTIPAGDRTVVIHHRTMASLLNTAADAGWSLERMVELPHHEYADQAGIPRLLACRWRLA